MGQFITLPEFIGILVICIPVLALAKTIFQTLDEKFNNQ